MSGGSLNITIKNNAPSVENTNEVPVLDSAWKSGNALPLTTGNSYFRISKSYASLNLKPD